MLAGIPDGLVSFPPMKWTACSPFLDSQESASYQQRGEIETLRTFAPGFGFFPQLFGAPSQLSRKRLLAVYPGKRECGGMNNYRTCFCAKLHFWLTG